MQLLLLLLYLAPSAFALKSSTLCPNGSKGNDFVCSVVKPVGEEDTTSQFTSISIGKNGQSELYTSAKLLEVLRSSLRNQTNTEAINTDVYSWFQTLGKATGKLDTAKSGTEKLVDSISSGLNSLQTSYDKTTNANKNKVEKAKSKAIEQLSQQIDKKAVEYYANDYTAAVEKCKDAVSKQVEIQQNRTRLGVEKAYDSLIDLTDQIGLCIQRNDIQGQCARAVQAKVNALNSLGKTAEIEAAKFVGIGSKSYEKDPCLQTALKRFEDSSTKLLKNAPLVD